ncbi:MAG: phosphatidate cytidylyltransferase [Deferribacteraceae bacterium]|jgi:phosphatidate cytidylyltransferase|nr:phosphatidate cytidylyltransferase [Deferribacteraceae bacterium]
MTNKSQRIITALFLIPSLILFIIYSSDIVFFVGLLVFILVATYEFSLLIEKAGYKNLKLPTLIGSVLIPFSFYIERVDVFLFSVFIISFLSLTIKLFGSRPLDDTYRTVGFTFLNVFYVPFYFSFIQLLKNINYHYIFYLLVIIWASDSFAYFFGIKYGKRRLYELISPKKSVEGLVAGVLGGVLVGLFYSLIFIKMPLLHVILTSLLVASAGVVGDLVESMFKRKANVKDSGNIFPGHGGMLDRIDSLLFGAPVLYFYIELFLI